MIAEADRGSQQIAFASANGTLLAGADLEGLATHKNDSCSDKEKETGDGERGREGLREGPRGGICLRIAESRQEILKADPVYVRVLYKDIFGRLKPNTIDRFWDWLRRAIPKRIPSQDDN